MPNTSATGGYLAPSATPAPLEGLALLGFLHDWVVGITGLDTNLVLPRWQPEPPNIPTAGIAWCAVGVTSRKSDTYPTVIHKPTPTGGEDDLQRHEDLDALCSFYDLGSTGQADYYAAVMRDGAIIPQNREALFLAGWGYVEATELLAVPSLTKQRWLYRVDVTFRLRRIIQRSYPVLDVLTEVGTITTDVPSITQRVNVPPPPAPP